MSQESRRIKVEPEPSPEIVAAIVAALSALDHGEETPQSGSRWKRRARSAVEGSHRGTRSTWRDRARLVE